MAQTTLPDALAIKVYSVAIVSSIAGNPDAYTLDEIRDMLVKRGRKNVFDAALATALQNKWIVQDGSDGYIAIWNTLLK